MPYYAGIELCQPEYDAPDPIWQRESNVFHAMKVSGAGGSGEVVQFLGRGNFKIAFSALLSEDDYATLETLVADGISRPLTGLYGEEYDDVYLTDLTATRARDGLHLATVSFER